MKGERRMTTLTKIAAGWRRRGSALGAVVLLAIGLLTGCVEVNHTSVIKTDLSGTTTLRLGVSKVALQALQSNFAGTQTASTPDNPFADQTQQITQLGGTSKPYENDKFIGIEISLPFKSLDEMQSQLNQILGSTSGGSAALVTFTAKSTATSVRIEGQVDPLSAINDPSITTAAASSAPSLDLGALLSGDGYIALSFTMPGNVTGADSLAMMNGNTVTWNFKIGDAKASIFAESAR